MWSVRSMCVLLSERRNIPLGSLVDWDGSPASSSNVSLLPISPSPSPSSPSSELPSLSSAAAGSVIGRLRFLPFALSSGSVFSSCTFLGFLPACAGALRFLEVFVAVGAMLQADEDESRRGCRSEIDEAKILCALIRFERHGHALRRHVLDRDHHHDFVSFGKAAIQVVYSVDWKTISTTLSISTTLRDRGPFFRVTSPIHRASSSGIRASLSPQDAPSAPPL